MSINYVTSTEHILAISYVAVYRHTCGTVSGSRPSLGMFYVGSGKFWRKKYLFFHQQEYIHRFFFFWVCTVYFLCNFEFLSSNYMYIIKRTCLVHLQLLYMC